MLTITDILEFEEGFKDKPYLCSMGYVTIGIGTKLHNDLGMNPADFPITVTRAMAREWMNTEIAIKTTKLRMPGLVKLNYAQSVAITSMAYQLGVSGLQKFKKMWAAIEAEDYTLAYHEALDSVWATQTPARAARTATVLRGIYSLEDVYTRHIVQPWSNVTVDPYLQTK